MTGTLKGALLDRALRAAAARAAEPGGVRFSERQLYYELCRVLRPWHRAPRRPAFTVAAAVRYADFAAALRRLGEAGGVPGLLPAAAGGAGRPGRHTPEADLFDYGLPRLLVCQSDGIARMLRANGLPMESACPVFGAGELPLHPGVAAMLDRAERAAVYVLHDASAAGLSFAAHLRALAAVPEGVRVAPLGLRPRRAGLLHLPRDPSPAAGRRAVEVAAVRPASLLRTVHRLVREAGPRPRRRPGLRAVREAGYLSWPETPEPERG